MIVLWVGVVILQSPTCREFWVPCPSTDITPVWWTDTPMYDGLTHLLYGNIDQTIVNSIHRLLNCKIGGKDCRVITTEYISCVHWIHMYHLLCNALVHVIYSVVSGQCSHTIPLGSFINHTLDYNYFNCYKSFYSYRLDTASA